MFSSSVLTHKFEVHPRNLSKEYKKRILETLEKEKNRTVSSTSGAISRVEKILQYGDIVSKNSKHFITCQFSALVFFPSIEEVYKGEITMNLPIGILIESERLVKVLIQPSNIPEGYKFDNMRKVFSNGIHSWLVGDVISFKVLNIKYKDNEINCIGSLKDVKVDDSDDYDIVEPPDDYNE